MFVCVCHWLANALIIVFVYFDLSLLFCLYCHRKIYLFKYISNGNGSNDFAHQIISFSLCQFRMHHATNKLLPNDSTDFSIFFFPFSRLFIQFRCTSNYYFLFFSFQNVTILLDFIFMLQLPFIFQRNFFECWTEIVEINSTSNRFSQSNLTTIFFVLLSFSLAVWTVAIA